MKKYLAIALALVLTLSLTVPALAITTDVGTGVTVSSGGGTIPIVKCKWEQEPVATVPCMESGDPSHATPGTQILPPMVKCDTKPIEYYAVITDEEDMGNVYEAFAIVYHPNGSPAPYNNSTSYWGNYFKYKIVFQNIGHDSAAKAKVVAANNAGLITFGAGFDLSEITNGVDGEMDKGTADLWMGVEIIDYEQPAGLYDVYVYAVDRNNNMSTGAANPIRNGLHNQFLYVPVSGVEVDFTSINYGSVNLNVEKTIAGDITWDIPAGVAPTENRATVRNIGNTWANVVINQSDMGFGTAGAAAGTALQGTSPAALAGSNWNVTFNARMGSYSTTMYYDPFVTVTLPSVLGLSCQDELDFSIKVKNGFATRQGTMTIGSAIVPFTYTGAVNCFAAPCDPGGDV